MAPTDHDNEGFAALVMLHTPFKFLPAHWHSQQPGRELQHGPIHLKNSEGDRAKAALWPLRSQDWWASTNHNVMPYSSYMP